LAQLAAILRAQIVSGELRRGRALPSLTCLMQHYGR
jgi:DNA-binding GntR family transcriptional regulator